MIKVPRDIAKYLVRDEIVEKEFILTGQKAYASSSRLFIKRGSTIRDISYPHISSIEYKSGSQWLVVLIGVLAGAIGYFLQQGSTLGWALIFAGAILVVGGFFWKSQEVKLGVVGLSDPQKLSGKKDELDSLFRYVRERRV
jgi:hypothetical protein